MRASRESVPSQRILYHDGEQVRFLRTGAVINCTSLRSDSRTGGCSRGTGTNRDNKCEVVGSAVRRLDRLRALTGLPRPRTTAEAVPKGLLAPLHARSCRTGLGRRLVPSEGFALLAQPALVHRPPLRLEHVLPCAI